MGTLPRVFAAAAAALGFYAINAHAGALPADLQKSLKPYSIKEATLDAGVLRITMDRPTVTRDMFYNIVSIGTCAPLWSDKRKAWGGANIDRVEVRNAIKAQGFAFTGGRKECGELGSVAGGDAAAKRYVEARTLVCVAGMECRPRRPGEVTAGDQ